MEVEEDSPRFDYPTIKPINKGVVHRICSGQVILDLSAAIKELVENSLDAGATSVEIALKDYGEEWFQVIDNGCGISPQNFMVVARKHHTSKLVDFPDLQSLTTFGFRGEALSSLCALGNLTIETRTKNEPVATHLTFDNSGLLTAERKVARQIGTSVTVNKLFSNLPVRSKEFHRNIRKEYGKLITLLNAYAIIAKRVRFICTNTTGKNVKSVILKTQGSDSLKDNIINVLGMNFYNCLEPISICIPESCKVEGFISKTGYGSGRNLGDRQYLFVNGRPVDMPKVSKLVNELYKVANSKQYPIAIMNFDIPTGAYDVNVTPDKRKIFFSDEGSILSSLRKSLENIYSPSHASYSVSRFEEPDKEEVRDKVRESKGDILSRKMESSTTRSQTIEKAVHFNNEYLLEKDFTLKVHGIKKADDLVGSYDMQLTHKKSSLTSDHPSAAKMNDSFSSSSYSQSLLTNFVTINKRKHENITTMLSETPVLRNGSHSVQPKKTDKDSTEFNENEPSKHLRVEDELDVNELSKHFSADTDTSMYNLDSPTSGEIAKNRKSELFCQPPMLSEISVLGNGSPYIQAKKINYKMLSVDVTSPTLSNRDQRVLSEDRCDGASPIQSSYAPADSSSLRCSTLQFSFKDLKTRRQQRLSLLQSSKYTCGTVKSNRCYAAATLELSQPESEERKARALSIATSELERLFNKEDFGRMKVIGQFNLGFIVGKLDQDLFIVDQHAADEKYNFERLSQSTILNQQPLLRPMRLELSPEEEVVASMHMDTIRKNGFDLEEDLDAPPGLHFKLKAIPFSKNITFGVEDVKELISTLADSQGECSISGSYRSDTHDSLCPSRVRAMLASRACRTSVRIGDALGIMEMKKILKHLVGLRSPWNCPHGRPTMRHLVDLSTLQKQLDPDDAD